MQSVKKELKIIASDNPETKDLVFLAIDKRVNNEGQLFYKVRVTSSPTGDPYHWFIK